MYPSFSNRIMCMVIFPFPSFFYLYWSTYATHDGSFQCSNIVCSCGENFFSWFLFEGGQKSSPTLTRRSIFFLLFLSCLVFRPSLKHQTKKKNSSPPSKKKNSSPTRKPAIYTRVGRSRNLGTWLDSRRHETCFH